MNDINTYILTGRLGADAELRYSQGGMAVWSARVAVNYGYGDKEGTNWLRVSAFGKRAEGLGKLELRKGARIGVSGELRVREYDAKDGTKGTSVEVAANDIALLDGKPADGQRSERPARQAPQQDFADDQDVPF